MDIKEAIESVRLSEPEKPVETKPMTNRYVVPEDSNCIIEIDSVCKKVNEFITSSFDRLERVEAAEEKSKILGLCVEALQLLDRYKNIRLNVELSRRIKFSIAPDITAEEK